ncbi:MAG: ammonium transporter, partial [Devosia sp.]|nr:ammonium transporter [Devosia sp.]
WTIIVYLPVAHWIWGGGFLSRLGVVDFAGGIVIHASAGISALVTARYLGRRAVPEGSSAPVSLPLVALGAGLLWFGWFGFNAGGAYGADALAAYAFTNTMLAGSVAMLVWMFWEWRETGHPTFSGLLVGAVTGLATITPASGYVEPMAALLIGAVGATACYYAKYIQSWLKVDDTLEVFRAHGVGGITGSILIGLLASSHINAVSAGPRQLLVQIVGILVVVIYAAEDVQREGLDEKLLGEQAFGLWNMKTGIKN